MPIHLILRLDAPLMSFGGVTIDNYGTIQDFPALSMLTGVLANALGWHRRERNRHQALQDRLVFAARIDREPTSVQDIQNARIYQKDQGWTTWGIPEGRKTSPSYKGVDAETPTRGKFLLQRRYRDYHADMAVTVALRLDPPDDSPTLEEIARAIDRPARPLFIGRKPCLPARPLLDPGSARWVEAETVFAALKQVSSLFEGEHSSFRAQWPSNDGPAGDRQIARSDQRNWLKGVHGGSRLVNEGTVTLAQPAGGGR